jgi:hypothetical protein
LFWTARIPDESVHINLDEGTAALHVEHQAALDFGSIPNAFGNGPSVASTVSYEIKWSGVLQRTQIHDASKGFSGLFLQTNATIDWKASNANGFAYASDDEGQTTAFAEIGRERNGVFFE